MMLLDATLVPACRFTESMLKQNHRAQVPQQSKSLCVGVARQLAIAVIMYVPDLASARDSRTHWPQHNVQSVYTGV